MRFSLLLISYSQFAQFGFFFFGANGCALQVHFIMPISVTCDSILPIPCFCLKRMVVKLKNVTRNGVLTSLLCKMCKPEGMPRQTDAALSADIQCSSRTTAENWFKVCHMVLILISNIHMYIMLFTLGVVSF